MRNKSFSCFVSHYICQGTGSWGYYFAAWHTLINTGRVSLSAILPTSGKQMYNIVQWECQSKQNAEQKQLQEKRMPTMRFHQYRCLRKPCFYIEIIVPISFWFLTGEKDVELIVCSLKVLKEWMNEWVKDAGLEKLEQCRETRVLPNILPWHGRVNLDLFLSLNISFSGVKLQGRTKFFQAGKVWALFLRVTSPFWWVSEKDIKGPRLL